MVNPLILRPYQSRIIENTLACLAKESRKGNRRVGCYLCYLNSNN